MRLLVLFVRNLLALVFVALALPFRALRSRRRPKWVHFRLKGDPPYRALKRGWPRFRRSEPAAIRSLHEFGDQLERLAGDPRVKGVLLEVEGFAGSAAKRAALSLVLGRFRARGKQVVGYAVSLGNGELELLCAADRIVMAPAGRLELTGYSAEATALGSGLKMLGVAAHFVRRGDYKTAPELFTREEVSPIQRQTLEAILEERFAALVEAIAKGRKLTPEEVRARIDEGPYSAKRAQARGLVDALVSEVDLAYHLAGEPVPATPEEGKGNGALLGDYDSYAASLLVSPNAWRRMRARQRVAVVPLSGMIVQGRGGGAPVGPRIAGSETVAKALRAAARDPRSPAIVLHIDSPGGSALGSELILEEVKRVARRKPVIAYFDEVAASGGYMAALGGTEIWAAPHAIAGSIGVFAGKFDISGLLERLGVRKALITRGENAAIFSSSRGFTDHERAALEAEIEETYQAFLEHVALARKRTREEIHAKAEGRIYSGRAAVEAGLVDRTGGFDEACRRALELAGKVSDEFDIALFAPPGPRLSLMRMLRQASSAGMFALWYPWFEISDRPALR